MVIAESTAITLAIRSSADNIINAYEEKNALEATITMDRRTLMQKLREDNKCVIIVTHSENVVNRADVIYELKKNKKIDK